jgi:hypothetical protein
MKKFLSIGMGIVAAALVLVSCEKQDNPKTAPNNTNIPAKKDFATEGKEFVNWNTMCKDVAGSCLEEVIIRPHVQEELNRTILLIVNGDKSKVQTEFAAQRDLLSEVFPTTLIDGVVNGAYTVGYHASPSINRNWFVFSAGNTIVNYVATPMN